MNEVKHPAVDQYLTARQVVAFQQMTLEMINTINRVFPAGADVICDVFRGTERYRIVAKVSEHQYSPGERITNGLNVELEDWQVNALKLHPMLVHKIRGKNVFEIPWDCVSAFDQKAGNSSDLLAASRAPEEGSGGRDES